MKTALFLILILISSVFEISSQIDTLKRYNLRCSKVVEPGDYIIEDIDKFELFCWMNLNYTGDSLDLYQQIDFSKYALIGVFIQPVCGATALVISKIENNKIIVTYNLTLNNCYGNFKYGEWYLLPRKNKNQKIELVVNEIFNK